MQPVVGLTSTNLTLAPVRITAVAVAMKVKFGTITSSPSPIFKAFKQQNKAHVPLQIVIAYLLLV